MGWASQSIALSLLLVVVVAQWITRPAMLSPNELSGTAEELGLAHFPVVTHERTRPVRHSFDRLQIVVVGMHSIAGTHCRRDHTRDLVVVLMQLYPLEERGCLRLPGSPPLGLQVLELVDVLLARDVVTGQLQSLDLTGERRVV